MNNGILSMSCVVLHTAEYRASAERYFQTFGERISVSGLLYLGHFFLRFPQTNCHIKAEGFGNKMDISKSF